MRMNVFKQLRADERGNALMIVAGGIPILFGAAALGIDTIQLTLAKRELQRKADTAALAGAHAVSQAKAASPAVTRALELGDQITLSTAAIVNNGPASGPYAGKTAAVEVILETQPPINFLPMFTGGGVTLTARAVASKVGSTPVCVLSLDKTVKYGIEMTGNSQMNLGCSIASNSNHNAHSLRLTGNLTLAEVAEVQAVGKIEVSGNASVPGAKQFPNSTPQIDPHAALTVPSATHCDYTNKKVDTSTAVTLSDQNGDGVVRYCGYLEIAGDAKVTLQSNMPHVIAGEFFKINGGPNSTVTGNGVTIITTSGGGKWAEVDWNGDTTINLSAPKVSSGSPYAGVLLFQDRYAPSSKKNKFNGNIKMTLRGSLYFPSTWFEWNGNAASNTDCLRIIADQMYLNGNIDIQNDCVVDDGVMSAAQMKRVRLVE